MPYLAAALALACVGLAIALVRVQGRAAEKDKTADAAVRDAAQLRAAKDIEAEGNKDEVARLRLALKTLHEEFNRAAVDVVASHDPVARRARMAELAKRAKISLGGL